MKNQALRPQTSPSLWVTGVQVEQRFFFFPIRNHELTLNVERARRKIQITVASLVVSSLERTRSDL